MQNVFPLVAGSDFRWGRREPCAGVGWWMLLWSPPSLDLLVLKSLPLNYIDIFWAEADPLITGSLWKMFLGTNLLSAASGAASRGGSAAHLIHYGRSRALLYPALGSKFG